MRVALCLLLVTTGCGRFGFATIDGDARGGDAADALGSPDSVANANVVFVSSTQILGSSLTSLAQADGICNDAAAAAGLSGQYVAWLSLGGTDAKDRLAGARGWVRPDGAFVADRIEDLTARGPVHPLVIDELGRDTGVTSARALTGTADVGVAHADTCATTGMIRGGRTWRTYSAWTSHASQACNVLGPLYCFGVDKNVQLTYVPTVGRRAFVSSVTFDTTTSLNAADILCGNDASAALLTGTFRALLGTSSFTAASRFDANGPPWVRLDGVPPAATAAAFLDGAFRTSLHVTAAGEHVTVLVATGGVTPVTIPASNTTTCGDWTSPGGMHIVGDANASGTEAFGARTVSCNTLSAVYCLEP